MGRESVVACMPTWPSIGASCAPMENSPPGIQTMPFGGAAGDGLVLGTVGPKEPAIPGMPGCCRGRCDCARPARRSVSVNWRGLSPQLAADEEQSAVAPPAIATRTTPAAIFERFQIELGGGWPAGGFRRGLLCFRHNLKDLRVIAATGGRSRLSAQFYLNL